MIRVWAVGEHENKTNKEIDQWRLKVAQDWRGSDIGGTIIATEGRDWITLEGDQQAVDAAVQELQNGSFLTDLEPVAEEQITERKINTVLTYHDDRSPLTSEIVDQCPG